MMVKCTPPTIIFLLCFLCNQSLCTTNSNVAACSAKDRQLLLHFKKSIIDPSHLLSSWSTEEDCCRWIGVQCHNTTGRVTKLNLTPSSIDPNYIADIRTGEIKRMTGEINLCVFELEFLNYLDLSSNNFTTIQYSEHDGQRNQNLSQVTTPYSSVLRHLDFSYNDYLQMDNLRWLALVPSLKYLDLSSSNLSIVTNWLESITTMLPAVAELRLSFCELRHQMASIQHSNFTSLTVLDLSYNYYLQMDNLRWLSHFPSLKNLDLSDIDLSHVTDWFQSLATMLPSITELKLRSCKLMHQIPSIQYANFTSLIGLDLSENFCFQMKNLRWLPYAPFLTYLDLTGTNLSNTTDWLYTLTIKFPSVVHLQLAVCSVSHINPSLLNLSNLKSLDLSENELNGTIPEWLGQFKHLQELDLSFNSLQGPIPPTLGNISSLIHLNVRHNRLNGTIPKSLGKLSKLETLDVAGNSMAGVLSKIHFSKLSNLKVLDLSSSAFQFQLGSQWVPPFQLQQLYLSSCSLGPKFPTWIYTQKSLIDLDISSNGISSIDHQNNFWSFVLNITEFVDISNNSISGDISNRILKTNFIDLSYNKISGGLPRLTTQVSSLLIGNNSFSGSTSSLLCDTINGSVYFLEYLDMSHNLLSGELSDCWMNWQRLSYINLGDNNLTGKIPHSMGSLSLLTTLHLQRNNFYGDVPMSLQNCKNLELLDLGENNLSGSITSWIGQAMVVIRLRANQFTGKIPSVLCQISSLIILDLAGNRLFGPMSPCLHKISFMSKEISLYSGPMSFYSDNFYEYSVIVLNKGQEREYQENLKFVRLIDLSSNNLSGTIPLELFGLCQLNILNLSHNHLLGRIPQEIGSMTKLESLDLSGNQLSGEIPQGLASLSFLSYLNLSYNNLSGKIPLATQLQSFSALSYVGNSELCGPPLTKNCTQEGIYETKHIGEDENQSELLSYFYTGMGIGFAIGFWGVCGMIFFNKACRHAYFRFIDHIKNQFISRCS
ncbi:hypothetical protein L6164_001356 [Bauhinia variegata]|uniref:Uncharacterized protein n=1 Tax=Bauhinia variegata TaxID=167791 RepID=A0ACB9QBH3_BAUVA|nr:hypothetical protein L6164_001356 [Bauhinia variegata]